MSPFILYVSVRERNMVLLPASLMREPRFLICIKSKETKENCVVLVVGIKRSSDDIDFHAKQTRSRDSSEKQ